MSLEKLKIEQKSCQKTAMGPISNAGKYRSKGSEAVIAAIANRLTGVEPGRFVRLPKPTSMQRAARRDEEPMTSVSATNPEKVFSPNSFAAYRFDTKNMEKSWIKSVCCTEDGNSPVAVLYFSPDGKKAVVISLERVWKDSRYQRATRLLITGSIEYSDQEEAMEEWKKMTSDEKYKHVVFDQEARDYIYREVTCPEKGRINYRCFWRPRDDDSMAEIDENWRYIDRNEFFNTD